MLLDHHYHDLSVGSGISDEVIQAYGFYSATDGGTLAELGFRGDQVRVPALVVPLHQPSGAQLLCQIKPDSPRTVDNRVLKYESPFGMAPVLDCPPVGLMREAIRDPKQPLLITEGTKKAASAVTQGLPCVSLSGVWSWRGTNEFGGRMTIPDLDDIAWEGRAVYIAYDNDVLTKPGVYSAMLRLGGILSQGRGASVAFVVIPDGPEKVGIDDFFVKGGTVQQLLSFSTRTLPETRVPYYRQTDQGVAQRIVDLYGQEMVYDNRHNMWFLWNGRTHWVPDRKGVLTRKYVLDYIDVLHEEAMGLPTGTEEERKTSQSFIRHAKNYGMISRVKGVEELAQTMRAEDEPNWDQELEILNCVNGSYNLATRQFAPCNPHHRLTVVCPTPFIEGARSPMWEQFMEERFPNADTRRFIQKVCGLFVTGKTPEKAFFIIRGEQDCGKTVFVETMQELLGDYANKVRKDVLMRQKDSGKQATNSVELANRRMVFVDESTAGDRIDDSFIKEITGGDATLKYRKLYNQEQTTKVQFTVVLATNYRPKITGDDMAIWRRVHLIEFGKSIPREKQDGDFRYKLENERPGILQWMVEGYRLWAAEGLVAPPEVLEWTESYRLDNDPLGKFLAENYSMGVEGEYCFPNDVHVHFKAWCEEEGLLIKDGGLGNTAKFSQRIRAKYPVGDGSIRVGNKRVFEGMVPKKSFRDDEDCEEFFEE